MSKHSGTSETVRLELALDDADSNELERVSASLRRQLLELDVDGVQTPRGDPAPEGARSPGVGEVGTLLVDLGSAGVGLRSLLAFLTGWLSRRGQRDRLIVTLDGDTITLDAATAEQQDAAFRLFLDRHGGGPAA